MTMHLHPDLVSTNELRRAPRVEFQGRAWCEHRQLTLYLAIRNLSREGLFLQTATPLAPGERVTITLQEDPAIVIEAEIVWTVPRRRVGGVGCRIVRFIEGADHYPQLLEKLRTGGGVERGMFDKRDCSMSAIGR
jgi:Tfp pilus assembly protein PilZ